MEQLAQSISFAGDIPDSQINKWTFQETSTALKTLLLQGVVFS